MDDPLQWMCNEGRAIPATRALAGKLDHSAPRAMDCFAACASTAVMLNPLPSQSSLPCPSITRCQTWTFTEQTKLNPTWSIRLPHSKGLEHSGTEEQSPRNRRTRSLSVCVSGRGGTDHGRKRSRSSRTVARACSGSACSNSSFALRATPATNRKARRGMPKPQDPMKKCGCCAARGRAIVFALYRTWRRRLNVSINKGMSLDPHRQMSADGT